MNHERRPAKARSTVRVTAELLVAARDAGREGISFSALMKTTNLAGSRGRALVERLSGSGLLARAVSGGLVITQNGLEFLDQTREFMGVADEMGLKI